MGPGEADPIRSGFSGDYRTRLAKKGGRTDVSDEYSWFSRGEGNDTFVRVGSRVRVVRAGICSWLSGDSGVQRAGARIPDYGGGGDLGRDRSAPFHGQKTRGESAGRGIHAISLEVRAEEVGFEPTIGFKGR